jgi:hypothetical protein
VVVRQDTPEVRRQIEEGLLAWDVPLQQLYLWDDRSRLQRSLPLRGDLRELSFNLPAQPLQHSHYDASPVSLNPSVYGKV